jgi:hypothetical protein
MADLLVVFCRGRKPIRAGHREDGSLFDALVLCSSMPGSDAPYKVSRAERRRKLTIGTALWILRGGGAEGYKACSGALFSC